MTLLANVLAKTASRTIIKIAELAARDARNKREGYLQGYREGYADAKAGKKPRFK